MKTALIFILIGTVFGFLIHAYFFEPETQKVITTGTEVVADTTDAEKMSYHNIHANISRIPIKEIATDKELFSLIEENAQEDDSAAYLLVDEGESDLYVEVASMDTVLKDHGELHVDYLFPPINHFNLDFDPFPQVTKTIVQTRTIQVPKKLKFYETQKAGFIGGMIFTATIVYLVK